MLVIQRLHLVVTAVLAVTVLALLGITLDTSHTDSPQGIQNAAVQSPLLRDLVQEGLVRGEAETIARQIASIHHYTGKAPAIALNVDHAQIGDTQGRLWRDSRLSDYTETPDGFCIVVVKGTAWAAYDSTAAVPLLGSGTDSAPTKGFCEQP